MAGLTLRSGILSIGVLSLVAAGCSENRVITPTAPTAAPAGPQQPARTTVRVWVADSAGRLLTGAKVEALDGPAAGTTAVLIGDGGFVFSGAFDLSTRFRASHDGHETLVGTPQCSVPNCERGAQPWMYFNLRPVESPVDLSGNYTLTLMAAASCSALPSEARSRSYPVTLAPRYRDNTADLLGFTIEFRSSSVLESMRRQYIGVAADYISLGVAGGEGDLPGLAEGLGENRYVAFTGASRATLGRGAITQIDLAFDGAIDLVTLRNPLGGSYTFSAAEIVAQERCTATGHRLLLERTNGRS